MESSTVVRIVGILCIGYFAYMTWDIKGIVLVAGLALCNKF